MSGFRDPVLEEVFVQWAAWQTLVDHLMPNGTDARDVRPSLVADAIAELEADRLRRLAHLLVGHGHVDSLEEALLLLGRLWGKAMIGRRPRFGAEVGLTLAEFERERPA